MKKEEKEKEEKWKVDDIYTDHGAKYWLVYKNDDYPEFTATDEEDAEYLCRVLKFHDRILQAVDEKDRL